MPLAKLSSFAGFFGTEMRKMVIQAHNLLELKMFLKNTNSFTVSRLSLTVLMA